MVGRGARGKRAARHAQELVEARIDCDADTILLKVRQVGAACHDGYRSCFYRRMDAQSAAEIVEPRLVDPAQVYGSTDSSG